MFFRLFFFKMSSFLFKHKSRRFWLQGAATETEEWGRYFPLGMLRYFSSQIPLKKKLKTMSDSTGAKSKDLWENLHSDDSVWRDAAGLYWIFEATWRKAGGVIKAHGVSGPFHNKGLFGFERFIDATNQKFKEFCVLKWDVTVLYECWMQGDT